MADEEWRSRQKAAIARQRAFQKGIDNDQVGVPAAESGPLASYTRGQTLWYIAQLRKVIADGEHLPNATGPGLTVLPGTERNPASSSTIDEYTAKVAELTAAGNYTDDELAAADAALSAALDDGVSLDPGTAAATAE